MSQGKAAARATDSILMGSCTCNVSGPLFGEKIVRTSTTLFSDAVVNSPYKGGTPSGIFGTAYEGKYGDVAVELGLQPIVMGNTTPLEDYTKYTASSVLDLARTPVIAVNYVASGTPELSGLTKDKILAGITALRSRHATGQLVLAITHKQALQLLNDPEMRNVLYGFQVMKDGLPDSILGCKLLVTDHVPLVNVGGRWVRACPLYHKDDLVYGIWEKVHFQVKEPGNYKSTLYAGATMMMGATRRRDEAFVSILCDEGIAAS